MDSSDLGKGVNGSTTLFCVRVSPTHPLLALLPHKRPPSISTVYSSHPPSPVPFPPPPFPAHVLPHYFFQFQSFGRYGSWDDPDSFIWVSEGTGGTREDLLPAMLSSMPPSTRLYPTPHTFLLRALLHVDPSRTLCSTSPRTHPNTPPIYTLRPSR